MRKLLLLLLPLSLILSSCDKRVDPVTFNDNLVTYSEDAEKRLEVLDTQIDDFFDNEEISAEKSAKLVESMKGVKDSIQSDLDKIKAMPQPTNGAEFHKVTVSYVESLIGQLNVYNEQYSKLTAETSDDELAKMDETINKSLEETQGKLEEMIKAQEAFAKTNDMQLTTDFSNMK